MLIIGEKLITYSSLKLFLIFLLMYFNWYNSNDTTPGDVTLILNIISFCLYLIWIYFIYQKSLEKLSSKQIFTNNQKLFNYGVLIMIFSIFAMLILSQDDSTIGDEYGSLNMKLTYTNPIEIAFCYLIGLLITTSFAAKNLVTLELNKEAEFSEYFSTILMLIFPFIGLWWIQSRAKKQFLTEL